MEHHLSSQTFIRITLEQLLFYPTSLSFKKRPPNCLDQRSDPVFGDGPLGNRLRSGDRRGNNNSGVSPQNYVRSLYLEGQDPLRV